MIRILVVLVTLFGAFAASAGLAHAQSFAHQRNRPPVLAPQPGCRTWRGTSSGNDPSTLIQIRLCPAPGRQDGFFTGELVWSSDNSGWNRRQVSGTQSHDGLRLTLRDDRILEERPNPTWRFCTVDRYDLVVASDGSVSGSYDSAACTDHGVLNLQPVTDSNAPPLNPNPNLTQTEAPRPKSRAQGCMKGCSVTPTSSWRGFAITVAASLLVLRVIRRLRS